MGIAVRDSHIAVYDCREYALRDKLFAWELC